MNSRPRTIAERRLRLMCQTSFSHYKSVDRNELRLAIHGVPDSAEFLLRAGRPEFRPLRSSER